MAVKCASSFTLVKVKDGVDGKNGTGVTISSKSVTYAASSSGTTAPSSFSTTIPTVQKGQYLWTKTYVKYSDGNETTSYSVSYIGTDGQNGAAGKGISSITYKYATTQAQTAPTSFTSTTIPTLSATNKYLWQQETITFTTGSPQTTVSLIGVYGDKGDTGDKGKSPVSAIFSNESFVIPADEDGIVARSDYLKIKVVVSLVQGNEYFSPAKSLTNGTFNLSYSSSYLFTGEIDGSVFKATKDSVMMADTEVITLTVNYKDFDGDTGTFTREIPLIKVRAGKDAILYFAWSKSETEFIPRDSSFFMWGSVFGFFGGKAMGSLPLQQWSTNREKVEALKDDEYCYLWAKLTEEGTPFLFTGKTGVKGLTGQYVMYQYAVGEDDATVPDDSAFSDTMPSLTGDNAGKYLWMRNKVVPSGGNPDDIAWNTPVIAGSDSSEIYAKIEDEDAKITEITKEGGIIETKISEYKPDGKNTISSLITQTQDSIALRVVGTEGGVKDKDGNTVTGMTIKDGTIQLNAENTLIPGSVTAGSLATDMAIVSDLQISNGAKSVGKIRSENYNQGDIKDETKKAGFYMDNTGYLEAKEAVFYNANINKATITDGEFDAGALKTVNERVTGSWICTTGFPDENGAWSGEVYTPNERSDGTTSLVYRGTMNYSQTPVGYWRGDEVLAWMRNNIPVNNTGFTKLEGTINGYSAYAKRFSEETWTSETNLASNNYTTISVDCGLYYKDLRITITNVAGSTEYLTFSVIQVDGTTVYDFEGDYQMSASSSLTLVSDYELSPGTHSIYLKTVCTYPSKITVYTSVTSVYGIDSNTIELRLYKNNDTTKVFAGGTSSDPLDVIYYGYEPFKNHRLIHDWINDSFASNYYQTIPINLSYGSASIKGGSGLTGWTLTRYNQFAGPWVVGKADDEGNVTWVRGTPANLKQCQYKVSDVVIDGTRYTQSFLLMWTGTVLTLQSYDGTVGISLSKNQYYTSLPFICYNEVPHEKGMYTASIYPMEGQENSAEIGSASQMFGAVYTKSLMLLFPVGSIYMSFLDTSPASFLGGTWERLNGGAGFWVQDGTADLWDSNRNPYTESEALPNLKGWFVAQGGDGGSGGRSGCDGSLFQVKYYGSVDGGTSQASDYSTAMDFNASAYNSIYGDNNPVRPKSYKVYAWRRTS